MNDERPILEYESSSAAAPASSAPAGDCTFTFSPPPVINDLVIQGVVVVLFTGGAVALAVKGALYLRQQWTWPGLLLITLCIVVCMMVASSNWRHLRNGMRFGGLPVKLTIANDHLIMANPRQWGLTLHAVPLEQIRQCYAEFGGWSLVVRTIYRINVDVRGRGTLELPVTSTDAAAVDRAVAAIRTRLPSAAGRK